MDTLKKLDQDLIQSLKEKNELKVSVIRLAKSAIKNAEISKKGKLEESEVIQILQKEAKKRRESITEFAKGSRQDLVDKEKAELDIVSAYLPEQLAEEEIRNIIKKTLSELQSEEKINPGKIMSKLMPQFKGKADGKLVSQIVQEELAEKH